MTVERRMLMASKRAITTPTVPTPSRELNNVAYANGKWVIVGGDFQGTNTGTIYYSDNGIVWTSATSTLPRTLYGLGTNGVRWNSAGAKQTGVTGQGSIYTSGDGVTWTAVTTTAAQDLFSVAYGNNIWVIWGGNSFFGSANTGTVYYSTNGSTWTLATSSLIYTPQYGSTQGATYGAGTFVCVGGQDANNNTGSVFTSTNGSSWTTRTSSLTTPLTCVTYGSGAGLFVAAGGRSTGTGGFAVGGIYSSPDGTTWTSRVSGLNYFFRTINTDGSTFVAAGGNPGSANTGYLYSSTNGTTWTQRISGAPRSFRSVCRGDNGWVAVGGQDGTAGTGMIYRSVNGVDWTLISSTLTNCLNSVYYADGLWVAVGAGNYVTVSADTYTWK